MLRSQPLIENAFAAKYRTDSRKKKQLDWKVITMIAKDLRPGSIEGDHGF